MDIFVTASWREGFPRSAVEAAATGLPTLATDIRGSRQVVADVVTGILVPVRDTARVVAIGRLGGDQSPRDRMGRAARERAVGYFDQQTVIDLTLDAYRSCGRSTAGRYDVTQ